MENKYLTSFKHFCTVLGFITFIVGGNIIYKEFILGENVFLIGKTDTGEDENISFQKPRTKR